MVARVHKAADHVAKGSGETREQALKRLGVSTQCGFASHAEGNPLTVRYSDRAVLTVQHDDMVAKLQLVRSIADEVWGEP